MHYWRELLRSSSTKKVGHSICGMDVDNSLDDRSTAADKCLYGRIGRSKKYLCRPLHGETTM